MERHTRLLFLVSSFVTPERGQLRPVCENDAFARPMRGIAEGIRIHANQSAGGESTLQKCMKTRDFKDL